MKKRVRRVKREDVMRIRETFESSKRRYGAPKIKKKLEHRGIIIDLNRVSRLMREEGMKRRNIEI